MTLVGQFKISYTLIHLFISYRGAIEYYCKCNAGDTDDKKRFVMFIYLLSAFNLRALHEVKINEIFFFRIDYYDFFTKFYYTVFLDLTANYCNGGANIQNV